MTINLFLEAERLETLHRRGHGCSYQEPRSSCVCMLLSGPVSKAQNAESARAVQDPEGDSQSEEIGMADRLDNEMDEGSMDTDEEHDHDDEDEHPDHFSDDDDEDDDDDDGGEVGLLGPPVYVVQPAGALLKVYLKSAHPEVLGSGVLHCMPRFQGLVDSHSVCNVRRARVL